MGRPSKSEEDRRQPVTLRFDPDVRARLEKHAAANGRSLGKEIEARVAATVGLDAQGLDLVRQISAEIVALTKRNKGKRWHADLTSWSAVAEMLAGGPISAMRPDDPWDEEDVKAILGQLINTYDQKANVVSKLAEIGLSISQDNKFGGLLKIASRNLERSSIDAIPDPALRQQALSLHDQLIALDADFDALRHAYGDAMRPYWEAELKGREIYRSHLQDQASHQRTFGEAFNAEHFLGLISSWR
ncbi:TraY domain-containing protein [Erythrobacter arachoides]|uniref:Relaxosome protein TraY n=1 Tax=Aurantiacibacter arachoides TaxID=1850444 RepID=A0A845A4D3_9SPHN|nr:TraY domain-containing protein [Aurantiacibacter arachoides]MXO94758.1 TraY domain-containing protein [Aurantiacibacter arachoides]GGD60901.1 hypothetical protein GCM10011411_21420 [Aurantiacibacter arachoides]